MSEPERRTGRRTAAQRLKDRYRADPQSGADPETRQMGAAYQAAMEAVFSIVIAVLLGWWADSYFESAPWGVLAGATIGFGAFVLRLSRLRADLDAPADPGPADGDQNGES